MTTWPGLTRQPLAQSLVLSVSIHLALLAFVQPWQGSDAPQVLVINARLQPVPEEMAPETPDLDVEQATEPSPPPEAVKPSEPQPVPEAQLSVPKPAPIQAAEPAEPEPAEPIPPAKQPPPQKTEISAPAPEATPDIATNEPKAAASPSPGTPAPVLSIPSPIDTNWYLARQVDKHPKAIGSITPKYPELARQRGQEGSLKLMVKIDDLGRVRDVEVVEAHPPGVFDNAALEAFRDARFQPAMKDGRPVRYEAYMRVEFKLE